MVNKKNRTPYMVAQEKIREKEVKSAKKYLKKIWGNTISIKNMSNKEIRKLGGELGMNVFNTKSFGSEYNKSQKTLKQYTRICKYCDKYYDVEIRRKVRPKGSGVCSTCKEKINKEKGEKIKNKNKMKWEKLVLDILRSGGKLSVLKISDKIGCSGNTVRKTLKSLSKENKIRLSRVTMAKLI